MAWRIQTWLVRKGRRDQNIVYINSSPPVKMKKIKKKIKSQTRFHAIELSRTPPYILAFHFFLFGLDLAAASFITPFSDLHGGHDLETKDKYIHKLIKV